MNKELYLKAFLAALSEKPTSKEKKLITRAFNFGYEVAEGDYEDDDEYEEDDDEYDDVSDEDDDESDDDDDNEGTTEFYEVENSSLIAGLFYDYDSGTLQVELNDGKAYDYYNVQPDTFEAFKNAQSKGQFFNKFKHDHDFDEA